MGRLVPIKILDGSARCYAILELFVTCDGYRTRVASGRYETEEKAREWITVLQSRTLDPV